MKFFVLIALSILAPGVSAAQCGAGTTGTNCIGPLTVQPPPGNKSQSSITLIDLGLPVPAPASGLYTLSIASGVLMETDNGNSYHSLVGSPGATGPAGANGAVGPSGAQGPTGATGTMPAPADYGFSGWGSFTANPGWSEIGNALYRNQIDMLSANEVRLVLSLGMNALPSGSFAEAEYTPDGVNWFALSGRVSLTKSYGLYFSGWQGMPTGSTGDYMVRIVTFNSSGSVTPVSLYQLHLQIK